MGTTFCSVHLYVGRDNFCPEDYRSFSEGWLTYFPADPAREPPVLNKYARSVSKQFDYPVLWFSIQNSDSVCFEFFRNGKRVVSYDQNYSDTNKNLYGVPALIGYDSREKRRLSRILSQADTDYLLALLEEYMGVCLAPVPEIIAEDPALLSRTRDDALYQKLLKEERQFTGKRALFRAELIYEKNGKLFHTRWDENHRVFTPHCYYYGYHTIESDYTPEALSPVRFQDGQLHFISQEEFDREPSLPRVIPQKDDRFSEEFSPYKITFSDKAPEAFRRKTLKPPRGLYFFTFLDEEHLLLTDERDGIAVVDTSLRLVARMRLKGIPAEYKDGCILTADSQSFYAYAYSHRDFIRIYRIHKNNSSKTT